MFNTLINIILCGLWALGMLLLCPKSWLTRINEMTKRREKK
jgi:hypothetical protein